VQLVPEKERPPTGEPRMAGRGTRCALDTSES
jgi:hypothetical protein